MKPLAAITLTAQIAVAIAAATDRVAEQALDGREADPPPPSAAAATFEPGPSGAVAPPLDEGPQPPADHGVDFASGFERLSFSLGSWTAGLEVPDQAGGWQPLSPTTLHIVSAHGGKALRGETQNGPYRYLLYFTFDQEQQEYRISSLDDQSGLLDIYEGHFDEGGTLIVTNLASGTGYTHKGLHHSTRMLFQPIADHASPNPGSRAWQWTIEASTDRGASWHPQLRASVRPSSSSRSERKHHRRAGACLRRASADVCRPPRAARSNHATPFPCPRLPAGRCGRPGGRWPHPTNPHRRGRWAIETRTLGPIDVLMELRPLANGWEARSRGVSPLVIELRPGPDGALSGPITSGRPGPIVELHLGNDGLRGHIREGLLAGAVHAEPFSGEPPLRDYRAILATLDQVITSQLYQPAVLASAGWQRFRRDAEAVATAAEDDFAFLLGLRKAWKNDPFSHFQVTRTAVPVADLVAGFDSLRVQRDAARLELRGGIAILTADTMMGLDTIEQIDAAYAQLATSSARTLVIDLRENDGGAFAVVPLVQHLLADPLEAGTFVANRWWRTHAAPPTDAERASAPPWTGWSISSFWRDAQQQGLLRIQFVPQAPRFAGRVFVLTSSRTASAAELAADALRGAGATLVGEKTSGEMLSGSYFELGNGFMVYLPIADYVSLRAGRIEGRGVTPDVEVPAAAALDRALELAGS